MKAWAKIFIALVILGAIGAWAGYTFIYNKAHTDFEKADTEYSLSAQEFFDDFRADPKVAGIKYTGKVIEINGKLSVLEDADDMLIAVFAFEEGMFGSEGIRVSILPNHMEAIKKHTLTQNITLKGFCAGYNDSDVIIESGSVVR